MAAVKTLIGNVKGPQGEKGEKGDTGPAGSTGIRGSRWAEGTAITGTSTEGTIFPDTGITDALVGDMYLNTSTGNVYRCTESGAASAARWVHTGNLKGPTGERGASGETGPKGDTGIRGSRIYQGTAVTGTSSTSEIFSGSGISDAMVDDVYINTADGNTYKCTVPGPAETARWAYTGCIRGAAGEAPEAADDMTVGFSASSERTNINTGEKMSTLMGKIKKWFADMTVAAFAQVISSNTDLMANTLPGYLVDALAVRQQFEAVNSNLHYTFQPIENEYITNTTVNVIRRAGVIYTYIFFYVIGQIPAWEDVIIGKIANWTLGSRNLSIVNSLYEGQYALSLLVYVDGYGNVAVKTHGEVNGNPWCYGLGTFVI